MKTIAILSLAVLATASAEDSFPWKDILPGEFEVKRASARPATRAMYLLYACGIDQYLIANRSAFEKIPYAERACENERYIAINVFRNYKVTFPTEESPDGSTQSISRDLAILAKFANSGYDGQFSKELIELLEELKKAEQGAAANP